MKYQEFEGGLKDLFHNAEVAVDMDALIGNIHNAKAPRKNNNWLLFCLFCLLAMAGVVGLNQVITSNHQTAEQGFTGQHSKMSKTSSAKQADDLANKPAASETDLVGTDLARGTESNTSAQSGVVKAQSTDQVIQAAAVSINKSEASAHISSPQSSETRSPIRQQYSTTNSAVNSVVTKNQNLTTNSILTTAASPTKNLSARAAIANLDQLRNSESLLSIDSDMPAPRQVECPTFKKGLKWHFDLIPEIGYIVPLKTLTTNSGEQTESFIMREADETPLEGLQAGLYGRIRPGNAPYYFKIGASYTRLSERMNLDVNYTRSDTTIGIISITESQNGDTLTVIRGEIITDTMYSRQSVDHYFLHMIDIPAAIGYSKSIGGGWRIGGEVGAQLNIGLSTKGKLLETADTYTDLPASGRFSPNVGLSFFAGLTLEKAISERGAFFVSPRFRYFPKAFTPDSYGVRQEYQFAGLHAGYIHSF